MQNNATYGSQPVTARPAEHYPRLHADLFFVFVFLFSPHNPDCWCRFMHDIMHGVDIIMASIQPALAAASPVSRGRSKSNPVEPAEEPELIAVPIRMAVYLTNTGIILPASSK